MTRRFRSLKKVYWMMTTILKSESIQGILINSLRLYVRGNNIWNVVLNIGVEIASEVGVCALKMTILTMRSNSQTN